MIISSEGNGICIWCKWIKFYSGSFWIWIWQLHVWSLMAMVNVNRTPSPLWLGDQRAGCPYLQESPRYSVSRPMMVFAWIPVPAWKPNKNTIKHAQTSTKLYSCKRIYLSKLKKRNKSHQHHGIRYHTVPNIVHTIKFNQKHVSHNQILYNLKHCIRSKHRT